MIWTLIVFGLLFIVLRKYAWPALLGAVEAREKALQRMLDEAEQSRVEAASLLEEHKRLVANAQGEARELIAKAKGVAEKEREGLLARAREEQDAMLARARKEIEDEKQKAVLALRQEAVDLALAAAGRLLEQKLDDEANRRIVTGYLETIDRAR
jgi:F-type H+-transporting ATPase subunit b